jgi:hypothetical protein
MSQHWDFGVAEREECVKEILVDAKTLSKKNTKPPEQNERMTTPNLGKIGSVYVQRI